MYRPTVSTTSTVLSILAGTLLCACQFDATGTGDSESAPDAEDIAPLDETTVEDVSLEYLDQADPQLLAGVDNLEIKRVQIDRYGHGHTRLKQMVGSVPVFGAEGIVHVNPDGSVRGMTDGFIRGVRINTTPLLTAESAIDTAIAAHGGWLRVTDIRDADLQILRHEGNTYLTYRVQIEQFEPDFEPSLPVVFIDAKTGDEVWSYDNLKTSTQDPRVELYDMHGSSDFTSSVVEGPLDDRGAMDAVEGAVHDHIGIALDYFSTMHQRNSYDDAGAIASGYAHLGFRYVNAFWDGEHLAFGDGDGNKTSDPLVALDVVVHEFSHAVTEHTAALVYANESGALNEASSDIFAAAAEAAQPDATHDSTWMMGEDCWNSDPNRFDDRVAALRYMDDPALAGDEDYYPTRYQGSSDSGGVHSNSGIANLWFYLLVSGEAHPRGATSVAAGNAVPVETAAAIWYEALAHHMTPLTDYRDARAATVAAAGIVDANLVDEVNRAWDAVGVPDETWTEFSSEPLPDIPETHPDLSTYETTVQVTANWDAMRIQVTDDTDIALNGGTGDADLFIARGRTPTTTDYDCTSQSYGSNESCMFENPEPGDYGVLVLAWASDQAAQYGEIGDVTGANLEVLYVGDPPPDPCDDVTNPCTASDACHTTACVDGVCVEDPVICADDASACTSAVCDPATGCGQDASLCETPEASCGDGVDNDDDGTTDCADSDCATDPVCTETGAECNDTLDNDGDGDVDCADSDCAAETVCTDPPPADGENTLAACSDGNDNDGDGLSDCSDPDCQAALGLASDGGVCEGSNGTCDGTYMGVPEGDWTCISGKCRTRGNKGGTCT